MPRYIDAELFSKNLMMQVYLADDEDFTKAFVKGMELVKKAEEETPTADVQEVKHGTWELKTKTNAHCSNCNFIRSTETQIGWKYCPKCGARMENGE